MSKSLITNANLVQTPAIIVKIGDYEFGKYSKEHGYNKYPNYIESLEVTKINGQVNTYRLVLNYAITEYNDPNYFEKVFASVSSSRKIEFTYGDMGVPQFMYKKEEGIITKVSSSFAMDSAKITYTVEAISQGNLAKTGAYFFQQRTHVKPSEIIYELLEKNSLYGLQDLFTGMRNISLCKLKQVIATNDLAVDLDAKINCSVLDYLQYLVDCMTSSSDSDSKTRTSFYILKFVDDTTDVFQGTYFQVVEVNRKIEHPEAYQLDIGYPNANCVFNFNVENNENYSIFYDYQKKLHPQEYVWRLNSLGEYEETYAPVLSSNNDDRDTSISDEAWWTKVSQYPIKIKIDIKGLLRPATLMSYVRLNVLFYGKKHINSGLYIVTKQSDRINASGFTTTLNLIKIASDQETY